MKRVLPYLLLYTIPLAFNSANFAQGQKDLNGKWICTTDYGNIQLEFVSESVLIFDGESANYQIIGHTIRVADAYGQYDYPFKLEDHTLAITFPEGYTLLFLRTNNTDKGPVKSEVTPDMGNSGKEYLLSGKLCHWSGSSGYSSGYSSSTWVFFDGKGGFTYGSETSFSSDAGMAYGQDPGGGNTGKYTVKGNQILLTFEDGSSGIAEVYFRQDDGRITELTYNGDHYSTGLCE